MPASNLIHAVLLRHGHYEQPAGVPSAWLPHPLTEQGRAQASAAVARVRAELERVNATLHPVVHASVLLRAYETATRFAEGWGGEALTVRTSPSLNERGLGAAANLTVAEIEAVAARDPRVGALPGGWKSAAHFKLPLPGAESLAEAGGRVAAYVESVCREISSVGGGPRAVVFVGHGAAFRHAAVCLNVLDASSLPALSMHHCAPVVLCRHGLGHWSHVSGAWKRRQLVVGEGND